MCFNRRRKNYLLSNGCIPPLSLFYFLPPPPLPRQPLSLSFSLSKGDIRWHITLIITMLWRQHRVHLMPFSSWRHDMETPSALLTYWSRGKMAAISKTTFSHAFSWIKMYEYEIHISLQFVPEGQINYVLALVPIMAWHRPGDTPFSESMVVNLPTHICVTRSQWDNLPIGRGLPAQMSSHVVFDGFIVVNIVRVEKKSWNDLWNN